MMETPGWLSEDEIILHRMQAFHHNRVEALVAGSGLLGKERMGTLVVHLIPHSSMTSGDQFDGAKLKQHGNHVRPLGGRGGYSRFNVDGLLNYYTEQEVMAYSQLFRDGKLESAMTDLGYEQNGVVVIRDTICEKAVFDLLSEYLRFCTGVGLTPPISMFSALLGCEGFRFAINPRWVDLSDQAIDRSPASLPVVEIQSLEITPINFLQPWCDTFWQAGGVERSLSYDGDGNWHERG